MYWRLCAPGQLYDRNEGLAVYFDTASGDTHLVNGLTAALLGELAPGQVSQEDLLAWLSGVVTDVQPSECLPILDKILRELEALFVVESYP